MKFTDAVLVLVIFCSLVISAECGVKSLYKLNEKANQYRRKTDAQKFISESFRKTCKGEGFKSLNEWQITCRSMWKLDYIGWCDASDFIEVSYAYSEKKLMYGKWNGNWTEGEVYCRRK